jgi:adenylate cyclase
MPKIKQFFYRYFLGAPAWIIPPLILWFIASTNTLGFSDKSRDITLDFLTKKFPYESVFDSYANQMLFIDIDDESLSAVGQWPWPRQIISEIFLKISKQKPLVIGLDIIFSEKDRYASVNLAKFFDINPSDLEDLGIKDGDKYLASILSQNPYVLATSALDEGQFLSIEQANVSGKFITVGSANKGIYSADKLLTPIKEFEASQGFGFVNTIKQDGVIRRTPLIFDIRSEIYPALNLDMIRVAQNANNHILKINELGDKLLIKSGDMIAQTDLDGTFIFHHGDMNRFPRISMLDVMNGNVDLTDKIVIIGSSASGLGDFHATNIASEVPGPLFHLQVIDQVLGKRFINHHPVYDQVTYFLALLFSVVICLMVMRLSIYAVLFLIPVSIFPVYFLAKYSFLGFGVIVNMPIAVMIFFSSGIAAFIIKAFIQNIEKKKIQNSFLQYVPENIVKNINKASDVPSLGGQEIYGTVFFLDIRGFTAITETLKDDPHLFVKVISHIMNKVTDILIQHEATIDKYIGDAVMVFWNAPVTVVDHQLKAYKAAKAIKLAIPEINRGVHALLPQKIRKKIAINFGIGISTGRFIVGNMGSEFRFNYSAMGDMVNIAARLEQMTKDHKKNILVGANDINDKKILRYKQADIDLKFIDTIAVRGKKEKIPVYEVI